MEIQLWRELLDPYQLAVDELIVKFNHLIQEHRNRGIYSPIESVDGRLKSIGSIMDKTGWKFTMYLNNILMIVAGILLFSGDRMAAGVVALIGMLIMGICYGGGITISASLIRTLYGPKHYASNFAICNLCLIPASILGPLLSAKLLDMAGGNYDTTFVMVIVLGVVTLALNFFVKEA